MEEARAALAQAEADMGQEGLERAAADGSRALEQQLKSEDGAAQRLLPGLAWLAR